MKKNIFRFVAIMMAGACLCIACGEKDGPQKPVGPKDDEGNENKPKAEAPAIKLDAQFEDWDAITAEVAKDNDYVAMYTSEDVEDPIQVMKITNDADNVYFYIEWNSTGLPQNASCSEWGDSWNGTPEAGYKTPSADRPDDETFRETVFLFIDPDGNDRTGFYTFEDAKTHEPTIPGLGCEMGVCWFAFYNYETKKVSMAWNQNNVGPSNRGTVVYNEDGERTDYVIDGPYDYTGDFFLSWPDKADADGVNPPIPLWGWLNDANDGAGDNIAPSKTNWFPAEAVGTVAKLEFAIEKKDITKLPDDAEEIAVGIEVKWGSIDQPVGPLRISYVE